MKLSKKSIAVWLVRSLLFLFLINFGLYADVIYLNNGNVLLVEKAWEEGDEVKYQTSKGIQSLPKSAVQTIRQEKPVPPPANVKRWSTVADPGNQKASGAPVLAPSVSPASDSPAVSKETLARLRGNLNANPSDTRAKAELVYALNSVASLQVAQGDLASAQSSLEEALNLDRRNPALLSNLAIVHFRLGNYEKTEDFLLECLRIDGRNQWAYYLLGEAFYKHEKIAQAISTWSDGLQLGPNEAISARLEDARRESGIHNELQAVQSEHFIIRYDRKTSNSSLGPQILATLEDLYGHLRNELTSRAPATVAVILYPDQAYFDITRAPGWSGGVFDGKIRIPIKGLFSVTSQLRATLAHELTHCFMTALPGRGSPTWFLEGVAQLEEGRSTASQRNLLAQLQRENRLIPLKSLRDSFLGLPTGTAGLAYTEGLSAVEYLIVRFGPSAIRNLLALMAQNYNFENAFNTAFQRSVSEFEIDWQRNLSE